MPDLSALLVNLAATLAAAIVVVLIAFTIGVTGGKHRIIDVFWGIGFMVVGLVGLVLSSGHGDDVRRWLVAGLTAVWGLRLGVHIGLRGRGEPEDPRYERMLSRAPGNRALYALRQVYLLQGVSLWFISWPVQVAQYDPDPLTVISYLGVIIFAIDCSSNPWAIFNSLASRRIRPTRERCSISGCGGIRDTRTTSATPVCGGGCGCSRRTAGSA